ncbi:DUF4291 domain-containing protein [Gilliamella sp. Gris1-4]|uniref:DUF4291 domain-containing protein n=1 Tax=Gilliamella sp. Gris1-4 TaxID=3120244 RepID=UPI00080EDCA7|nr:DUF4291 domain-containing protein [Gilliamella apicola]OCG35068.1 hypothetical protein A9G31_09040 [Gilliamella apicola]OCG67405.1 hypothetical protein A9G39_00320 [Gilliamella apicola]
MKEREIRAVFDKETITVYQAYRKGIALPAVKAQTFVSPFKVERMTWIKPSFLWMMYRSGWAEKEGQEHILAVKIKREGFEWALENACLSTFKENIYKTHENWKEKLNSTPVRIQWDPEKNIKLDNLDYKSIQIGLKGEAVKKYVKDWIVQIDDITDFSKEIHQLIINNEIGKAKDKLPKEKIYPLPDFIRPIINADL